MNEKKNEKKKDQPEDTLIWAGSERPNSLGQSLARQFSITRAVDPAYGVEPTERCWRLGNNLPFQVVLQSKREAIQEARTDGSRLDVGRVGAAVVWFDKRLDKWQEKRCLLGGNKDSFEAELWDISDALVLDIKKNEKYRPHNSNSFY